MTRRLTNRISDELWDAIDGAWAQARTSEPGLTKEKFLERLILAGLKMEEKNETREI